MNYDCLIVDDEEVLAKSTEDYFNLFGVKTISLYSYNECVEFFKNNTCELILLDINLGDGSGFELCKYLREQINIPILFISSKCSPLINLKPVNMIIHAAIVISTIKIFNVKDIFIFFIYFPCF